MEGAYHAASFLIHVSHQSISYFANVVKRVLSVIFYPLIETISLIQSIYLFISSLTLASGHTVLVIWTINRILINLVIYFIIVFLRKFQGVFESIGQSFNQFSLSFSSSPRRRIPSLYHQLIESKKWSQYEKTAKLIDRLEGVDEKWKFKKESHDYDFLLLEHTINLLVKFRAEQNVRSESNQCYHPFHYHRWTNFLDNAICLA